MTLAGSLLERFFPKLVGQGDSLLRSLADDVLKMTTREPEESAIYSALRGQAYDSVRNSLIETQPTDVQWMSLSRLLSGLESSVREETALPTRPGDLRLGQHYAGERAPSMPGNEEIRSAMTGQYDVPTTYHPSTDTVLARLDERIRSSASYFSDLPHETDVAISEYMARLERERISRLGRDPIPAPGEELARETRESGLTMAIPGFEPAPPIPSAEIAQQVNRATLIDQRFKAERDTIVDRFRESDSKHADRVIRIVGYKDKPGILERLVSRTSADEATNLFDEDAATLMHDLKKMGLTKTALDISRPGELSNTPGSRQRWVNAILDFLEHPQVRHPLNTSWGRFDDPFRKALRRNFDFVFRDAPLGPVETMPRVPGLFTTVFNILKEKNPGLTLPDVVLPRTRRAEERIGRLLPPGFGLARVPIRVLAGSGETHAGAQELPLLPRHHEGLGTSFFPLAAQGSIVRVNSAARAKTQIKDLDYLVIDTLATTNPRSGPRSDRYFPVIAVTPIETGTGKIDATQVKFFAYSSKGTPLFVPSPMATAGTPDALNTARKLASDLAAKLQPSLPADVRTSRYLHYIYDAQRKFETFTFSPEPAEAAMRNGKLVISKPIGARAPFESAGRGIDTSLGGRLREAARLSVRARYEELMVLRPGLLSGDPAEMARAVRELRNTVGETDIGARQMIRSKMMERVGELFDADFFHKTHGTRTALPPELRTRTELPGTTREASQTADQLSRMETLRRVQTDIMLGKPTRLLLNVSRQLARRETSTEASPAMHTAIKNYIATEAAAAQGMRPEAARPFGLTSIFNSILGLGDRTKLTRYVARGQRRAILGELPEEEVPGFLTVAVAKVAARLAGNGPNPRMTDFVIDVVDNASLGTTELVLKGRSTLDNTVRSFTIQMSPEDSVSLLGADAETQARLFSETAEMFNKHPTVKGLCTGEDI